LHLAALATAWGPQDEVLVPAFTWISTPNAVEYAGARPVFCDIAPITLNLDPLDATRRITARTRGIIPVHLFGLAADMEPLLALARAKNLVVIEDAACALGCQMNGRHAGTIGDMGCFSFHPRKSITTGEGGMLVTSDSRMDAAFRSLRDIGSDRASLSAERAAQQLLPDFPALGYNYRMTDLQAALGATQLQKFGEILRQRQECARQYHARITGSSLASWLRPPPLSGEQRHAYQAYVCQLIPPDERVSTLETWHERRNRLMRLLFESGIATRPGTHAPHLLTYYRTKYSLRPEDYPNAWRAAWLTLALPLYPQMTGAEQERVCSCLELLWPATA
jgi:dTDP-4-amino-4,6-dideoxygalactose transaminase